MNETPRIYVASLADYNAGRLHGCWIDANQSADAIREQIVDMLAESKEPVAEDYAVHDYEHFGDLELSEYTGIDQIAAAAYHIVEHGPVFASLLSYVGGTSNIEEALRYMEDGYCGEYESLTDYAEQFIDDCYSDSLKNLPEFIRYHIDYEGIARDMELGGDVFTLECDCKIHIFYTNI
ncbi:MAG: antirestriction protein ArdA [Phycisphaerae bacterium]|nr:antirestriction protein ArdA [Phycisphaerae bacterium]